MHADPRMRLGAMGHLVHVALSNDVRLNDVILDSQPYHSFPLSTKEKNKKEQIIDLSNEVDKIFYFKLFTSNEIILH